MTWLPFSSILPSFVTALWLIATLLPTSKAFAQHSLSKANTAPQVLFNGKDLEGWHADVPEMDKNPAAIIPFQVRDGMLVSLGTPGGHLITNRQYQNYRLEVEYRFADKPGNCGLLVHASTPRALYDMFPQSVEVQMSHGDAGDFWCIREDITVPNMEQRRGPKENWGTDGDKARRIFNRTDGSENSAGEWNTMTTECLGNTIKVRVNGELVNYGTKCTADNGQIAIQAEGSEVEFRKIELRSLLQPIGSIPIGLQLYSLRDQLDKDVPGTLDKVRDMGIVYVETAGTYALTPEQLRKELDKRGLKAISGHFGYGQYRDDLESIIREANILDLEYAGSAWIEHEEPFDENECRQAIAVFNKAGEALAKQGIKFFYHTHGYEFQPHGDGTLFDLMMAELKPEFVRFQMDVFWVAHAGRRPAEVMKQYPGRFELTHLKDMKRGTVTGVFTGHSDPTNSVSIGSGQIAFDPILAAAKETGVKWHFIEDESLTSLEQIPQSLRFLREAMK